MEQSTAAEVSNAGFRRLSVAVQEGTDQAHALGVATFAAIAAANDPLMHSAGEVTAAIEAANDRVVHTFAKNAREDVRVTFSSYKGRPLIDLRVFYRDAAGEMRPTPKGLAIARELLPELETAVAALRRAESEEPSP